MRIMMLAQFYPPIIGGEERMVHDLSVELAARGHHVVVATLWHPGLPTYEQDAGVHVYRVRCSLQRLTGLFRDETGRQHAPPWPDPELTLALDRVLALEKPDIVHAHNWMVFGFLPLKSKSGARLVMTLHDYSLLCPKKRLMHRGVQCTGPGMLKCIRCATQHYGLVKGAPTALIQRFSQAQLRSLVDHFVAISHVVAERNGLSLGSENVTVVPDFVPDAPAQPRPPTGVRAHLPEGDYLLFVGDLSRDKGIDTLIAAYTQLNAPPPLVLIGRHCADTPARFPAGVRSLGPLPHEQVLEAWAHSTIGLVPSVWAEPFGLVALEAMAAGVPLVASRIGGLMDIVVHEETGLLCTPGDASDLAFALERLIASSPLRRHLGEGARCRVAQFEANSIVPRVEQLYRTVLRPQPAVSSQSAAEPSLRGPS